MAFPENLIISIIAGLLAGGGEAWFTARATAAQKVSEAAGKLAESYGRRLDDLERFVKRQGRYVRYLLDGIKVLHAQAARHGEPPDWSPEDIDVVCPDEERRG